jgi:RNA polymerase sigma-70 factor (ECF subfamily)
VSVRRVAINGQPGAITLDSDDRVINAIALEIDERGIRSVSSVVNPDKLRHLGPVADINALIRGT